jgi:hypothetical protein
MIQLQKLATSVIPLPPRNLPGARCFGDRDGADGSRASFALVRLQKNDRIAEGRRLGRSIK